MLIYPHRITQFEESFCDVCKNNISTEFISVNNVQFMGLQHCSNTKCCDTATLWLSNTTIDQDELKEKYGETIIIQRSNGKKESGWKLCSNAYKEKEDGPFWVKVRNQMKTNTKYISLQTLQAINQS